MESLFSNYADTLLTKVDTETLVPIKAVDAFEFITSIDFLSEDPFPAQRVIIKTLYNLWPYYPPDREEDIVLKVLEKKWHIRINLDRTEANDPVMFLVLVLGRRSTKSTVTSWFACFSAYSLICKGNPQRYYRIRERHPIHITHIAASGAQAADVFTLTSNNIKRVPFFRPYIDFDKDNSTELRLFSPSDNLLNQQLRLRNSQLSKGLMKENRMPGSILIESITASAATNRGNAIYFLMFSEFAHTQRAKMDLTKSADQIAEENPQTDYALWKAMVPSVKDFGTDGKVVAESSPREKGGEFYHQYSIAGGMEQEIGSGEELIVEPRYAVIQMSTWEARPTMPRETFDIDFRTDPRGANMEYGAHFGNPSGQFIDEKVIAAVPQAGFPMIMVNPGNYQFVISVDPGGKAKMKKDDTYAIAWGHCQWDTHLTEDEYVYWIDGMQGWNASIKSLGAGNFESTPVDPNMVVQFIIDLVRDLGGRNFIHEIVYDQWQNQSSISTLQSMGFPALETTFTNPYKAAMYSNFLSKAQLGQVKMYGVDVGGYVERWKLEMKFLQQDISGKVVYYHHPASGPVQNDDFADVVANLTHRLITRMMPTAESMYKAHQIGRKIGIFTPQVRRTIIPLKGPSINSPKSNPFRNR